MAERLLPRLTDSTRDAFEEAVQEGVRKDGDHSRLLLGWQQEIEQENPVLLEAMNDWVSGQEDPSLVIFALLKMYSLLRAQATVDKTLLN